MPEPLRATRPLCQSQGPEGWFCTLPAGHDGDHVATVGPARYAVVTLGRWPQAPPEATDAA
jgi:hypothetical protein